MPHDAIDVHVDLRSVSSQLRGTDRKFATAVRKEIRTALSAAGSDLVSRVRDAASWSTRIPGATSVKTSFSATRGRAEIAVDAKRAPHARALELGNKNTFDEAEVTKRTSAGQSRRKALKSMKSSGVGVGRALRHPVFDSQKPPIRVGEQPVHPFFFPAAAAAAPRVQRRMEDALDKIARAAGFN